MSTVPSPETAALLQRADRYYVSVYQPRRIVLERGQGSRMWDSEGRDYVDFSAGIAVNSLGHADPELIAALTSQAARLWHTSNVFVSEPPLRLAQELVEASGFAQRVYLCNSGTEANEAAIKLVRKWATANGREPQRRVILTFHGSFHGRTLAAVTATAQPKYQQGYEPLPGGFRHCDYNDLNAVEAAMAAGDVAAVLVEPVQGEGGVVPAADGFLAGLRNLCDRHQALLVYDEIQCGMGRSGSLWAWQQDGVAPDVLSTAKALGAGFPIGALLVGERAADVFQFGSHGTTFGGNPLAAAVARVALRRLSDATLLGNVAAQAAALRRGLAALNDRLGLFELVRGRGLMLGAVLAQPWKGKAGAILDFAAGRGLLLLQAGPDVLRFVPALNIGTADIEAGLARLGDALDDFLAAQS